MKHTRDDATFQAERRLGIGSSDAAAVLGLSPYKTATDIYLEKLGLAPPVEPTPAMTRGIALEPLILEWFADTTACTVLSEWDHPRFVQGPEPYMIAHLDAWVKESRDLKMLPLEIKAPGVGAYRKMQRKGLDDVKLLQIQHQLLVTKAPRGIFAVFSAELWSGEVFEVDADPIVHQAMIENYRTFWDCVTTETPPEMKDIPLPKDLAKVAGSVPTMVDNRDEVVAATERLRDAIGLRDEGKSLYATARDDVMKLIVTDFITEVTLSDGLSRLHLSEQAGRLTFDQSKLLAQQPLVRSKVVDVIADYTTLGADQISALVDECVLDVDGCKKRGDPFPVLRPYFGR